MSRPVIRGARATLVLSMALSFLGICGLFWAYVHVRMTPNDIDMVAREMPVAQRELTVAQLESPLLRGVQIGNLLASALLLFSSVLLTVRRRTALWWTHQALLANGLYTVANAAGLIWFTYGHQELVDNLGGGPLGLQALVIAFFGLVMLTVYLVLFRVSRRQDVQAFVAREPV